ncbi:IS66 family insertion sequence element accessory protein TnpA [Salipaludibacillus sp. HK11]|uniref:IS66 family insertion sequence element accessory protein TnpA n=1 Tax=Salipaludibacillus sp. HK11 TaxID=3394320 RepID=UPI0039FC3E90
MDGLENRRLWEERIAIFKASRLSVRKWVQTQEGITEHQVKYWLKKFKREASEVTSSSSRWLPVSVPEGNRDEIQANGITIDVHGVKVDVSGHFEEAILRDVIKVLKTS